MKTLLTLLSIAALTACSNPANTPEPARSEVRPSPPIEDSRNNYDSYTGSSLSDIY